MDTLGAETLTDDAPPSAVATVGLGCRAGTSKSAAGHMNKHNVKLTPLANPRFDLNCLNFLCENDFFAAFTCTSCLLFAVSQLLQQALCFALCMRGRWRKRRTRRRRVGRFWDWRGASRSLFSRRTGRSRVGVCLSSTSFIP